VGDWDVDSFEQFLNFLHRTNAVQIGVPMFTIAFGIGVPFIAHYWYSLRVKQWEMSLKHTMLERGMSAADITAVLAATTTDADKKLGCGPRGRC
jgi:hypothetical protein